MRLEDNDISRIASDVLAALDARTQIESLAGRYPGLDVDTAYRVTAEVRKRRAARGERPIGRKIGFTNRTIWPEYGVYAPIWGDMYATTVRDLGTEPFKLSTVIEPRLEPEIVFGLKCAPEPGMDEVALFGCVDWIAHGFEIVQSIFPAWKFTAPDTIAAFGLHGAYLLGPHRTLKSNETKDWFNRLAQFEITLECNGALRERGHARDVLDGPLSALRHLVELLSKDKQNPPLAAGEIVTTGTLTRARPIAAGETWRTVFQGLPLDGLTVRFV